MLIRLRPFLGYILAGAGCFIFAIFFFNVNKSLRSQPALVSQADPIIDIWINKMLGFFLVLLPDNTAKLYQSYSFELDSVGRWRRVEDRAIYPESPKTRLPSYRVEFENDRLMEIYLYPVAHHYSIAVEDRIIGHRGFNRLSDVDDPNGFYNRKFTQRLFQELSTVDSYWKTYQGRPQR
jgi:hypothetical protein